jgi:hypothetical protein
MTDRIKQETGQSPEQKPTAVSLPLMSRRNFGKLLGAQAVLASAATLSACGGGGGSRDDGSTDPGTPQAKTLTSGAFLATISDYFEWPHSSEYKDRFANAQPSFVDVAIGVTEYARQIETALEEGVVSNAQGYFHPDEPVRREDAADMYVKAFGIPPATGNPLAGFSDADSISANRRESVEAIVAAGFMGGASATAFSPKGALSDVEAREILERITSTLVSPVQVMPKPGTTSPRRYVSYMTPTPGATIYITETRDGSEPADPTTATAQPDGWRPGAAGIGQPSPLVPAGTTAAYDPWKWGARQYTCTRTDGRPEVYRVKAAAKKDGRFSGVREFVWNIYRPAEPWPFEAKLVHAPTATTPAVWQIYNVSESVQANAYYIEGSAGGIIFDFLQYAYRGSVGSYEGMITVVDQVATKPYIGILGHNHPDHVAQIASFTDNNIPMYMSAQDKGQLINNRNDNNGYIRAGNAGIVLTDGQVFDLGNCKVTAWCQPGHEHGLVTLIINETGWVYATDMWACNRPYTADTTAYTGVKTDLMLSLVRQLWANYLKSSLNGEVTELTNAHQDFPVSQEAAVNFIKVFQNVIDNGAASTFPSIRTAANSRMGWYHKGDLKDYWGMWRDKNWMACELGGSPSTYDETQLTCMTRPTADAGYPTNAMIDYNGADGYKKYSVLANVEIEGGELVGRDIYWAAPANGVDNKLPNKFDPWTSAYTIEVPNGTGSIVFKPTPLSTKITSMRVNGSTLAQDTSVSLPVSNGARITVDIVAQDGSTSSSYTFTVAMV